MDRYISNPYCCGQIFEKYKIDFETAMDQFAPIREEFFSLLEEIPFLIPIPSMANYITCRLKNGYSASGIAAFLLSHHYILIKNISGKYFILFFSIFFTCK
jgi:histidinol-phosphate/aromatic aminotransferase/cobyric acid decarboxylase-like protein